ncbi:MAG: alpha-galactosidase [Clostridiales bacterium]|nr:alpha-galactosidase [Clostridiales bacterium]
MKPTSATISFLQNGVQRELDLMSSESGSILKFEAALEDHHTKIRLMPEKSIEISELKVVFPYNFEKKDTILMNGYQSWTVCKEYSLDTTNVMAEQVAKIMRHKKTDNCGDREFTNYEKENRWLHGVSYGYVRRGPEFYFFGSLNEQQGFTFFDINTKDNTLTVRKELQSRFFDHAFTALDVIFLKGTEDEVFDQYFEKLGITSTHAEPMTGYTTWYRHQQDISEKVLVKDIQDISANAKRFPCQVFCIDEGYENAIGDWLTPKKQAFPHGIYPITKRILSTGLRAGIWIAPFICEKRSRIFKNHNDWLLRDSSGNLVKACSSWKNCYCLDTANPAFRRHLKNVLMTMRDDWGVSVFKFDFLYAACMLPSSSQTRAEKMFDAIHFLKDCVGDSVTIACGVPLMAAAGVVDYCQVSCDLSAEWFPPLAPASREQNSTYRALLDMINHRQLSGRAFEIFTNVLPINNPLFFFSKDKRFLLGRAMGLSRGMILTSDDLTEYDAEDTVAWNTIHELRHATIKDIHHKDQKLIVDYELYKQPQRLKISLLE